MVRLTKAGVEAMLLTVYDEANKSPILHASLYTPGEGSRVPPPPRLAAGLGLILICGAGGYFGHLGGWVLGFLRRRPLKSN